MDSLVGLSCLLPGGSGHSYTPSKQGDAVGSGEPRQQVDGAGTVEAPRPEPNGLALSLSLVWGWAGAWAAPQEAPGGSPPLPTPKPGEERGRFLAPRMLTEQH